MLNLKKQPQNGSQIPVNRAEGNLSEPSFSSLPSLLDRFFNDELSFNMIPSRWGNLVSNSNLGTTLPAVNIRETGDSFIVELAAPGMNKKDFKVECNNQILHIYYTHSEESKEGSRESDYWRQEFNFTSFDRSFQLPETVNSEQIQAKYEDGILRVTMAKKEEARKKPAREISVN